MRKLANEGHSAKVMGALVGFRAVPRETGLLMRPRPSLWDAPLFVPQPIGSEQRDLSAPSPGGFFDGVLTAITNIGKWLFPKPSTPAPAPTPPPINPPSVAPQRTVLTSVFENAGQLIGPNGATLISPNGGTLISPNGGMVIGNDGNSLISNDGGSLISNDGGSVISTDGASIVSPNGGTIQANIKTGAPTGASSGLVQTSGETDLGGLLVAGNFSLEGGPAIIKGTGVALVEVYDLESDSDSIKLANISTRGRIETTDNVMIGGFIVGGTEPTTVLVRALGPSLTEVGVADALEDPMLELHDAQGNSVTNDNWRSDQAMEIATTTIPPTKDAEPALSITLVPGAYTAVVRGKNDTTGVALVEVFNLQ